MPEYPQEITQYPQEPNVLYKEKNGNNFQYTIIQEGVYPSEPNVKYTLCRRYKIPNNYKVKTTWGRRTVKCSINYINNKPVFYVYYGQNFENHVESNNTASHAATLLHKVSKKNKAVSFKLMLFIDTYDSLLVYYSQQDNQNFRDPFIWVTIVMCQNKSGTNFEPE